MPVRANVKVFAVIQVTYSFTAKCSHKVFFCGKLENCSNFALKLSCLLQENLNGHGVLKTAYAFSMFILLIYIERFQV